jgi:putative flippase GtrA
MNASALRLWRVLHTPEGKRMFRYTMVSVITTLAGFTILGVVFGVFHLWTEIPSAIFSSIVATAPSYYLNRNWVWGKAGRSHLRREVIPFWAVSIVGIFISVAAAAVSRHISTANHLSHTGATVVLLAITLAAFGVLWILKFLVFNRLFMSALPTPDQQLRTDL